MTIVGSHCLLELYDCAPSLLDDPEHVLAALREAADAAKTTVLNTVHHRFQPHGVTAIALLAESHISIHTWPEHGTAACDVFTCGRENLPEAACRALVQAFACPRYEMRRIARGESPDLQAPLHARTR